MPNVNIACYKEKWEVVVLFWLSQGFVKHPAKPYNGSSDGSSFSSVLQSTFKIWKNNK